MSFKQVEGSVIINAGGVFLVKDIYERIDSDRIYAGYGSGYIRLGPKGFTSKKNVSYEDLEVTRRKVGYTPTKDPRWET